MADLKYSTNENLTKLSGLSSKHMQHGNSHGKRKLINKRSTSYCIPEGSCQSSSPSKSLRSQATSKKGTTTTLSNIGSESTNAGTLPLGVGLAPRSQLNSNSREDSERNTYAYKSNSTLSRYLSRNSTIFDRELEMQQAHLSATQLSHSQYPYGRPSGIITSDSIIYKKGESFDQFYLGEDGDHGFELPPPGAKDASRYLGTGLGAGQAGSGSAARRHKTVEPVENEPGPHLEDRKLSASFNSYRPKFRTL